jgi:NAD(P)-dependent dehydrogenase (short-subunit alcohol dehydrogenase family)
MWQKIAENQSRNSPAMAGLTPREVFDRSISERMPLGREQTPEHIGRAVAFLASDDASEITGQALNVNGGAVMN